MIEFAIILAVLFVAEQLYFKLATRFNILDKPNARSSHTHSTIRGGGVIFPLAATLYFVLHGYHYPMFFLGLICISLVSFIDDIVGLSFKTRLSTHFLTVLFLFYECALYPALPWWLLLIAVVVVVGAINAINFMDGINGITGLYSLVTLLTLQYVNLYRVTFVEADFIWTLVAALLVFLYYNLRKNALCFAGDIGSISIAFCIMFLSLKLLIVSQQLAYVLFLLVYGIDSILTIVHRLTRGDNILKAHRFHFYQIWANEGRASFLLVSCSYAVAQLIVNCIILFAGEKGAQWNFGIAALLAMVLSAIYIIAKGKLLSRPSEQSNLINV